MTYELRTFARRKLARVPVRLWILTKAFEMNEQLEFIKRSIEDAPRRERTKLLRDSVPALVHDLPEANLKHWEQTVIGGLSLKKMQERNRTIQAELAGQKKRRQILAIVMGVIAFSFFTVGMLYMHTQIGWCMPFALPFLVVAAITANSDSRAIQNLTSQRNMEVNELNTAYEWFADDIEPLVSVEGIPYIEVTHATAMRERLVTAALAILWSEDALKSIRLDLSIPEQGLMAQAKNLIEAKAYHQRLWEINSRFNFGSFTREDIFVSAQKRFKSSSP